MHNGLWAIQFSTALAVASFLQLESFVHQIEARSVSVPAGLLELRSGQNLQQGE
jgi:hypothetical protein